MPSKGGPRRFLIVMVGLALLARGGAAPAAPLAAPPAEGCREKAAASEIEILRALEKAFESSPLVRVAIYFFVSLFFVGLFIDVCFLWRLVRRRASRPAFRPAIGWGIWDVARAVIVFLMAVVVFRLAGPAVRYLSGASDVSLTVVFQFLAELVTLCFLFRLLPGGWSRALTELKITRDGLPGRIFTGVKGYVGFLPVLFLLNRLTVLVADRVGITLESQEQIGFFFAEISFPAFLFLVLFVAVLGPIIEEVFFRGFSYQALRRKLGRWPSILLTSLLFAALHGNFTVFLPIMGLGVLLAYVFETSGSLVPCFTIHICQNGLAVAGALLVKLYT